MIETSRDSLGLAPPKRGHKAKPILAEVDERGCHICVYHAPRNKMSLYPVLKVNGRLRTIAQLIVYHNVRPLMTGEVPRHTCDNPRCINPDHLIPGTTADNNRDKVDRGRQRGGPGRLFTAEDKDKARRSRIASRRPDYGTHCPRGHIHSREMTGRRCFECDRIDQRERYRRRKVIESEESPESKRDAVEASL